MKKHNIILGMAICLIIGSVLSLKPISLVNAAIDTPRGVVVEGGDRQYELRVWWINPSNSELDHVNVYYSRLPLENFGIAATNNDVVPNEVSNGLIRSIDLNTWYYIYVTAVDGEGNESEPTTTLKRRSGTFPDLTSTTPVIATSIGGLSHNALTLNWTNPGDDDFFRTNIYRSTESSVAINETNLITQQVALPSTAKSYVDNNLSAKTLYYYRLVAEDTKGNISDAIVVSGNTLSSPVEPIDEEPVDVPEPPAVTPSNIPPAYLFDYQASFVGQNGTIGAGDDGILTHIVQANRGSVVDMWIQFKNDSAYQWWFKDPLDLNNIHEIRLGLTKDVDSPFTHNSWISTNRLTKISENIFPNQIATLNFKLHIPEDINPGAYKLSVGLVAEWIKWIYDDVHWEIMVI